MKIWSLTISVTLFFAFSVTAQESSIMVLNVKGQVDYLKEQSGTKERLLPGMKILETGALNLQKESRVNLLCNGKRIQLDKQGTYDLKTLVEKNSASLSMSFAGRFWDFVSDGLSHSDNKESLHNYNEKLLAVSGGVKGFATNESTIKTIMPESGNIGVDIVTFNWYHVKRPSVYHFKIYLISHEELVFKAITKDTSITLDFSQLVFLPSEAYEWSVEIEDEAKEEDRKMLSSELKTFEYFSNAQELIVQKAEKISDYKTADNFEKQWMEAIVMEQENFNYDAYNRYLDLRLQHPENLLIKKLFAAFLVRQGLTDVAIEQINE